MPKRHIIIQARMTSTRLPKKVMLPLCDKSALEIMFDRLSKFKENIIIATTNDGSEKDITTLCEKLNIKYYRGDTNNVLSRYYESAIKFNIQEDDTVVRLTSDCPLMDGDILENVITFFENSEFDYVSNVVDRSFPRGLDIEVFKFSALKKAYENASLELETEHVTTYIHTTHKSEFKIGSFKDKEDNSIYRLTLDEKDDYEAIKEVYKKFDCKIDFSYEELIYVLKQNPYIYEINSHIEQKKLSNIVDFINLPLDKKKMILEWRNDERVSKWMVDTKEIPFQNHLNFIESLKTNSTKKYFLVGDDGVIDFNNITSSSAEIGLYSNPNKKGVGKLLMSAILDYGFNSLKLEKLYLKVNKTNQKAINLYKKFNFENVKEDKNFIFMELENS
jgi:spore coat polysaccharide biosynthesis protein SpsF